MKKIVIGIIAIVAALTSALWLWLDGKPETQPDIPQTIEQVNEGINLIKEGSAE